MSKKLLNEAAVRRFMGLAGMEANVVSNTVNEMYKDEGKHDKEEEGMYKEAKHDDKEEDMHAEGMHSDKEEDMHAEGMHDEKKEGDYMEEEMDAMEGEHEDPVEDEMGDAPEMEITSEEAEVLANVLQKLMAAKGDMGAEPELDAEEEVELADDDAVEAEEDAEDAEELMEEKEEEMNEDEIVQEVARRVAARNLKAKKAQKEMNEALGK